VVFSHFLDDAKESIFASCQAGRHGKFFAMPNGTAEVVGFKWDLEDSLQL